MPSIETLDQCMPFAAGTELNHPLRVEVRERYRTGLVLDDGIVDARAAAADQPPGFAVGCGEPASGERLESGDAACQQIAGHGGLRQFAAAAAALEDGVRRLGRGFG